MLLNKKYISVKISETRLKKRNRGLSFLFEMSNFLSGSMEMEKILSGALAKVLAYLGLEAGRIYLLDESESTFHLEAFQGIEPTGLEQMRIDEGFTGRAARTKSFIAMHVTELENNERTVLLLSKGFKIIICIPLIAMGNVVGVMNLASRHIISLDQEKIDICTAAGNLIAIATNNARTYEDLKDKIKVLKDKKDMIKFFAYSVSHDLKSPAIGIYGLTKLLRKKCGNNLDEKGREYCNEILKAGELLVHLVEKINVYIAAKETSLNLEIVNVKEITSAIQTEFSEHLKKRKIRWIEPDFLPEITADSLSLMRVFRNLVDNALKYGGESLSKIKIEYEENDAFHIFFLSDDGVGIKGKNREKIFEVFHRDETSKGVAGSGLGLAIVKELVARHHGNVCLADDTENGTTFRIAIAKLQEKQSVRNKKSARFLSGGRLARRG